MKSIKIRYSPTGEIRVEAFGFEGEACKQASEVIEKLLGEVEGIEYKAEWWALNGDNVVQNDIDTSNLCG